MLAGKTVDDLMSQPPYILLALTQRWYMDVGNIDSKIEVFSECAFGNHLFQVAVSGVNQSGVERYCGLTADSLHVALLDGAQKLRLHTGRCLTNLIQEKYAAIGLLENPSSRAHGACKSPLFMAEQLSLQ